MNLKRSLAFVLSLLMVLGVAIPAFAAAERISGTDRFATAVEISKQGWDKSDVVVLASGLDFPDALAGVPLAYQLQAPILLTEKDVLTAVTKTEIERLGAKEVFLLGGLTAISQAVEDALKALDLEVTRIAGADRYETAALIAEEVAELAGGVTAAVVAYASNYPDALAAASYAAQNGMPILLTATTFLPDATKKVIEDLEIEETIVVGGTSVINATVFDALPGATRVAGTTREGTALALAEHFGVGEFVYIATGYAYADAITGAALAAKNGTGILLVGKSLPSEVADFLGDIQGAFILGGTNAVSAAVANAIADALYAPEEEATEIEIVRAVATSNTQVRVTLGNAPLKNLKASDFKISPALTITSVTTVDNVATLTTGDQSAVNYTITPANGTGSATFKGVSVVVTGEIASVEMLNLRQIKISFTKPVLWGWASDFENYYVGMTDLKDAADLQYTSFLELFGDDYWMFNDDDQLWGIPEANHPYTPVSYVIFESVGQGQGNAAPLITDLVDYDGLNFGFNREITIQARNILDSNGSFIHSSQGSFIVRDVVAPKVASIDVVWKPWFATPVLDVWFDEPVNPLSDDTNDFVIHINGIRVREEDLIWNIATDETAEEHMNLGIDILALDLDVEHRITIAGAKDLNNNVQVPNLWSGTFKITEDTTDPTYVKPKVESVTQIADNVLKIQFDRNNVIPTDDDDVVVTLKNAAYDPDDDQWVDLLIKGSEIQASHATNNIKAADRKTIWFVEFPAVFSKEEADSYFCYNSANSVKRDIVVTNYIIEDTPVDLTGNRYTTSLNFITDAKAPVIANASFASLGSSMLYVSFKDDPWNGWIQENVDGIRVLVSMTAPTKSAQEELEFSVSFVNTLTKAGWFAGGKHIAIDLTSGSEAGLTTADSYVVPGAVYTVTIYNESLYDAPFVIKAPSYYTSITSIHPVLVRPEYRGDETEDYHPFVKDAVAIKIPLAVDDEGRVPQTSPALIGSGWDITDGKDTVTEWNGTVYQPGSKDFMLADKNLNNILIVFDGQVDGDSAKKKGNYTLNGKPLPEGATVTYYVCASGLNSAVKGINGELNEDIGFVLITLPENTIERTADYTIIVKDVANLDGKKMLPVATKVLLQDNTGAKPINLTADESNALIVTFDEAVYINNPALATGNLVVVVNGREYAVSRVEVVIGSNNMKYKITLAMDFGATADDAKTASVTFKKADGHMWFVDEFGNPVADGAKIAK